LHTNKAASNETGYQVKTSLLVQLICNKGLE